MWALGLVLALPTVWSATGDRQDHPLIVGGRTVHVFRSPLGAYTAEERLETARRHIAEALLRNGEGWTSIRPADNGMIVALDGQPMFVVTAGDVAPDGTESIDGLANRASRTLQTIWIESRERNNPALNWRALLRVALGAVLLTGVLAGLIFAGRLLHRRVLSPLAERLHHATHAGLGVDAARTWRRIISILARLSLGFLGLFAVLGFITYTLRQFATSRPLGDDLMRSFDGASYAGLDAVVSAIPGLFAAAAIFAAARFATAISRAIFDNISAGRFQWGAFDASTAQASRYLVNSALWLFALVMAYPYLPGSHTEAFKGLSVLLGIMVSIGAAGPVGQIASGLILAYTRALYVGEYVRIADQEGTVAHLGLCVTRLRTGAGEEISLPNSVVMNSITRNFSRLAERGGMVVDTAVTIGYDIPWRQVHGLLLEAAARIPEISRTPAPYVVQTALSDFYVVYRLVIQTAPGASTSRLRVTSELHAAIQDVFNANRVQIMSPHYENDPAHPKLAPTPGPGGTK